MKKTEIIKRRHEVTIEIQYNLQNNCHQCPFFNSTENLNDCKGCVTFGILNRCGEELDSLTREYRSKNKLSVHGELLEEPEDFVIDKRTKREKLMDRVTLEEIEKLRSYGNSMEHIAKIYKVSKRMMYQVYNHLSGKVVIEEKDKKITNFDRLDEVLGFDEYVRLKTIEKKNKQEIADMVGFGLASVNAWARERKKERGIEGYL